MPGPAPKDPALRQRTNKKPTAGTLAAADRACYRAIPDRTDGQEWHPRAVSLWEEAWRSPMADEYLEADVEGLLIVADLTHLYWQRPSAKTAAELRQQRIAYGLDPMARRRLQWEVARVEQVTAKPEAAVAPRRSRDPRLRLVAGQ